jgi:hypothetical protein
MTPQTKKRRTFWITPAASPAAKERALALTARGYDVRFFASLDRMASELETKRASVVVVSDEGDEAATETILVALMTMPEVQGARLILATTRPSDKIYRLAACSNFRDIIPLDLDEKQFLTRFVYATAGRALKYVQPAGQIALKNISAVSFPARITWINQEKLRLECRVKPTPGSSIVIGGALARALGVPLLTARVAETQRSHLIYRFSEAVIADWQVPASVRPRANAFLGELEAQSIGPRTRIFIAVQSPDVRTSIMVHCDNPRFEVSTALQKQSIVDDPKFFTPDVVFIEDVLAAEEGGTRFRQMLSNMAGEATVFVIGKLPALAELQKQFVQHKLVALPRQGTTLAANVLARHLPHYDDKTSAAEKHAVHLASENPYSIAEVQVTARLTRIHPLALQLALPFPVSHFAVVRVESPLIHKVIGRAPYVKVTGSYPDSHPDAAPFSHLADAYIADCTTAERQALAAHLTRLVGEAYTRLDLGQNFLDSSSSGTAQRTPEFGSVKDSGQAAKARPLPLPTSHTAPAAAAAVAHAVAAGADGSAARDLQQLHQMTAVASTRRDAPLPPALPGLAPAPTPTPPAQPAGDAVSRDPLVAVIARAQAAGAAAQPRVEPAQLTAARRASLEAEEQARVRDEAQAAKRREKLVKDLRTIGTFVGFVVGALVLIWLFSTYVAPNYNKSGSVYSDQLLRFAPDRSRP